MPVLKNIAAAAGNVFGRNLVFFLVLSGGVYSIVDHRVVNSRSMDYLREAPQEVMSYALGGPRPSTIRLRQGVRYYKNFIGRFPGHSRAYTALGYCYYLLGDLHRATRYYELSITRDPSLFGAYYNLGLIAFENKDFALAARYFKKAVSIPPENQLISQDAVLPNWPEWSGRKMSMEAKRLGALRQCYAVSYEYLAWCYDKLGDHQAVMGVIRSALAAAGGGNAALFFQAGKAAYALGLEAEAVQFLRQSLIAAPNNSEAFEYLARISEKWNRVKAAAEARKQARAIKDSGRDSEISPPPLTHLFYYPPFVTVQSEGRERMIL